MSECRSWRGRVPGWTRQPSGPSAGVRQRALSFRTSVLHPTASEVYLAGLCPLQSTSNLGVGEVTEFGFSCAQNAQIMGVPRDGDSVREGIGLAGRARRTPCAHGRAWRRVRAAAAFRRLPPATRGRKASPPVLRRVGVVLKQALCHPALQAQLLSGLSFSSPLSRVMNWTQPSFPRRRLGRGVSELGHR